ncbi:hypothetical protein [Fluviispira sanaruensis]|uniref:Uncharacterized protein n=1 Tax=Fluviispira sanaruensis TaxID=2493639 RepID=A0A4P2VMG8_FLUSA|nr:hypothetical protein [Fluviispira sanaruensis]BBH54586.1 hypothetical protein JCM31447_30580 [Fluviispira sanaruensis]
MLVKYSFYFLFFIFSNSISAEENQTQPIIETITIEYSETNSNLTVFMSNCFADGKNIDQCEYEYYLYVNHRLRVM